MARTKSPQWEALLKSFPDSRKINSVSEGAEILYLRLLAVSDDLGRYYADPAVIHARIFTFRARDVSVTEAGRRRDELVRAGLVRVYRVEGEEVLELVDVYRRQRRDVEPKIAFPGPEKADRDGPVTPPSRARDGDGPLDQTRQDPDKTQNPPNPPRGARARFDPLSELPDSAAQDLTAAWAEWCAHRRESGKTLKPTTVKAQLRKLDEWGAPRFIAALRHSTAQGYQGLFEPKADTNGTAKPATRPPDTHASYRADPDQQATRDRLRERYEAQEAERRAKYQLPPTEKP
jgi:hypothetical protein